MRGVKKFWEVSRKIKGGGEKGEYSQELERWVRKKKENHKGRGRERKI